MTTTLSTRGMFVSPAAARRKLKLAPGERLAGSSSVKAESSFAQLRRTAGYELKTLPVSGLPRMVASARPTRKVLAEEITRLNAELS